MAVSSRPRLHPPDQRQRLRAASMSLGVGVIMLALKMGAYLLTGSATILSDALESVVHVAAVGFMFWAFHFSSAPPDAEHPYGHGKAEYLSVGFEGGAIVLAAGLILWQAVMGLIHGDAPARMDLGFALIMAAAAINLVLGWWLLRVGRRTRSTILIADGHHVLSDVWTSLGVLAGVGTMWLLPEGAARVWCDGLVAIALAVFIVVVGARLVRQAMHGLLDASDPREIERVVDAINQIRVADWIDVHNLRLRRSGDQVFIDFHLVVPGDWTVAEAHDNVERLEHHLLARLGSTGTVMIHLDHGSSERYRQLAQRPVGERVLTVHSATRVEIAHG